MPTQATCTVYAGLLMTGLLILTTTGARSVDALALPPGDMEIAHIAYTAGVIDIRYAHLALAVSENPDVRAFAETMLRDHGAVNEKAVVLLQELDATPQDNPTSRKLVEEAAQIRRELMGLSGAAFDQRYAANELAYHQFVNDALENQFIPAAENARFKRLLESALETFKVHEQHAEEMNRNVNM